MNKKMNRLLWMLVALLSLAACTEDTEYTAGVWYRRSDFDGVARMDAAGFTIGNKGYLCGGYRGSKKERLKDLVKICPMRLSHGMPLQDLL